MNKQLDQMTNEELGKLFPIIISDPNPNWIKLFQIEKIEIEKMLGKNKLSSVLRRLNLLIAAKYADIIWQCGE